MRVHDVPKLLSLVGSVCWIIFYSVPPALQSPMSSPYMAAAPRTLDEGEQTSSVHARRAEHLSCDAFCRSESRILP